MTDFSAEAIIRLIKLGLARQGIEMPHDVRTSGARVELGDKRALLADLHERHGPIPLLRIGEALREAPEEPILIAMQKAKDPFDLIERWQRLERYVHSRHRTIVLSNGSNCVRVRHISEIGDEPPTAAEDLLIAGVLTGFMDLIGVRGLDVHIGASAGIARSQIVWAEQKPGSETAVWAFAWKSEHTENQIEDTCLQSGNWMGELRERMAADPSRRWTLEILSSMTNTSPRTLQRRLKQEGSSFSSLIRSVRLAQSARMLAQSTVSPAEIGYACGFSDQAHFSREFKKQTAFTPGAYRQNFA